MTRDDEPRLAAPGAGLPFLELLLARGMFRHRLRAQGRPDFDRQFREERGRIGRSLREIDPSRRGERVLIRRLRGLEDSSRHWSAWMTLDHLRICHQAFAGIIAELAAGRVPAGEASTAAVKPSPGAGREVEAAYDASCDALLEAVAAVPELATPARHAHPWFGPLDAAGWHALAALHLAIHRRQLERIASGLARR